MPAKEYPTNPPAFADNSPPPAQPIQGMAAELKKLPYPFIIGVKIQSTELSKSALEVTLSSPEGPIIYVVKMLSLADLQRCNKINNFENILQISGILSYTETQIEVAFEHAPQGSLYHYLDKRGGQLPLDEALEVLKGVATALCSLHASNMVHGDVKPANILLCRAREYTCEPFLAKLGDFDFMRECNEDGLVESPGCTRGYASPEQIKRDSKPPLISPASDVYAFALTALDILCGRGGNTMTPDALENQLGEVFLSMLEQCLDNDPAVRPTAATILSETTTLLLLLSGLKLPVKKPTQSDPYRDRTFILYHCVLLSQQATIPPATLSHELQEEARKPVRWGALIRGAEIIHRYQEFGETAPTTDQLAILTNGGYLAMQQARLFCGIGRDGRSSGVRFPAIRRRLLFNEYQVKGLEGQAAEDEREIQKILLYSSAQFPYQLECDTCMVISYAQALIRELRLAGITEYTWKETIKPLTYAHIVADLTSSVYGSDTLHDISKQVSRLRSVVDITNCDFCKSLGVYFTVLDTKTLTVAELRDGRVVLLTYRPDGRGYHAVTIYAACDDYLFVKDGALPYHFDPVQPSRIMRAGTFNPIHTSTGAKVYVLDTKFKRCLVDARVKPSSKPQALVVLPPEATRDPIKPQACGEKEEILITPVEVEYDMYLTPEAIMRKERAIATAASLDVTAATMEYGDCLLSGGHYERAYQQFKEAMERYEASDSDSISIDFGLCQSRLATAAFFLGKLEEALVWFESARKIIESKTSPYHKEVAKLLYYRGYALALGGRLGEAYNDLVRSVDVFKKSYGEAHKEVVAADVALGYVLVRQGKTSLGCKKLQDGLKLLKSHYNDHPIVGAAHCLLGYALEELSEYEAARKNYDTCTNIIQAHFGPGHRFTANATACHGRLLLIVGGTEKEAKDKFESARAVYAGLKTTPPEVILRGALKAKVALGLKDDALSLASAYDSGIDKDDIGRKANACVLFASIYLAFQDFGIELLAMQKIKEGMTLAKAIDATSPYYHVVTELKTLFVSCVCQMNLEAGPDFEEMASIVFDNANTSPPLRYAAALKYRGFWHKYYENKLTIDSNTSVGMTVTAVLSQVVDGKALEKNVYATCYANGTSLHFADIEALCDHIVYPLHVVPASDGNFYLVYKQPEHGTLADHINKSPNRALMEHSARDIFEQILVALVDLQKRGLTFGDIDFDDIWLYSVSYGALLVRIRDTGKSILREESKSQKAQALSLWAQMFFSAICGQGENASIDHVSCQLLALLRRCLQNTSTLDTQAYVIRSDDYFSGAFPPSLLPSGTVHARSESVIAAHQDPNFLSYCVEIVSHRHPMFIDPFFEPKDFHKRWDELIHSDNFKLGLLLRKLDDELQKIQKASRAMNFYEAMHRTLERVQQKLSDKHDPAIIRLLLIHQYMSDRDESLSDMLKIATDRIKIARLWVASNISLKFPEHMVLLIEFANVFWRALQLKNMVGDEEREAFVRGLMYAVPADTIISLEHILNPSLPAGYLNTFLFRRKLVLHAHHLPLSAIVDVFKKYSLVLAFILWEGRCVPATMHHYDPPRDYGFFTKGFLGAATTYHYCPEITKGIADPKECTNTDHYSFWSYKVEPAGDIPTQCSIIFHEPPKALA